MSDWCQNRFEITGKSVCIELLLQWVNGEEPPRYRNAVQQSIQLFLAGCAGILKPVKTTSFTACQALVRHGTGLSASQNTAYEQWLDLLERNVVLNNESVRQIERIYHQSGISALKWENIPHNAQSMMTQLITRHHVDWFGIASLMDTPDAAACWESLRSYPERAQPCDMLMVIPPSLATELNGLGGLLLGMSTTTNHYCRVYGMEWPSGHNVNWTQQSPNSLTLFMDTPWYPPAGELVAEISALFECEIRHTYLEPNSGLAGFDCYDQGTHVDGHPGLPDELQKASEALLAHEEEPQTALTCTAIVGYSDVRG